MAKLPTPIPVTRLLKILGNDIKVARIRRRITSELMAQRIGISRITLAAIEKAHLQYPLGMLQLRSGF